MRRSVVRLLFGMAATGALSLGCVERTVSIHTEPEGATITLNDDEIGQTPIRTNFTWYGDYDVIIRKPGYKTLRTHYKVDAPWYQIPIIDVFSECLVPYTIHDDRVMPIFTLEPITPVDKQGLIQNAEELRQETMNTPK